MAGFEEYDENNINEGVNCENLCYDPGWRIKMDDRIIESVKLKTTPEKGDDEDTKTDTQFNS